MSSLILVLPLFFFGGWGENGIGGVAGGMDANAGVGGCVEDRLLGRGKGVPIPPSPPPPFPVDCADEGGRAGEASTAGSGRAGGVGGSSSMSPDPELMSKESSEVWSEVPD